MSFDLAAQARDQINVRFVCRLKAVEDADPNEFPVDLLLDPEQEAMCQEPRLPLHRNFRERVLCGGHLPADSRADPRSADSEANDKESYRQADSQADRQAHDAESNRKAHHNEPYSEADSEADFDTHHESAGHRRADPFVRADPPELK